MNPIVQNLPFSSSKQYFGVHVISFLRFWVRIGFQVVSLLGSRSSSANWCSPTWNQAFIGHESSIRKLFFRGECGDSGSDRSNRNSTWEDPSSPSEKYEDCS